MRIIRFVGEDNEIHYGTEPGPDGLSAELSDLFAPQQTGRSLRVVKLMAPLLPPVIYCIGLNYMKHYEEGAKKRGEPLPPKPKMFFKPVTSLNRPGGDIWVPQIEEGDKLDYECELVMVIGKAARNVAAKDALDYVLGFTCANDVSARYWQRKIGMEVGKTFDSHCPIGPVLVTRDEIGDPQTLRIQTRLNGNVMQVRFPFRLFLPPHYHSSRHCRTATLPT
jgi:2-keto-4-pentenoate hydratase/2-oxohepta-3-ene-1,7-dioic acid hydratase in catechol pathway